MSLIGIGLSALRAAQTGLATTGHNIANVNTPGFSRQQTILTPSNSLYSGAGYVGQGVTVSTVSRVYSDYLTQSLRDNTASSASASTFSTQVARVDGYLADTSSGLSAATDNFFAAAQSVANNPADSASRQTLLSTGRTLATRFNDLANRLQSQSVDVDRQIDDTVSTVNALARQVATLNSSILNDGRDPTNNQVPNDLLDQRDALVQQIAGSIGVTALPQSDGSVNLFAGNGQPLVVGGTANTLTTVPDDQDSSKKQLAVVVNGQPERVSTAQVTDGTLGGLFKFRDQVLTQAGNTLGQIAIGLGSALNAQNALGQDLNGNAGGALFSIGAPTVDAGVHNSTGSGLNVTIADPKQLTTSDYRLDYDGTNYTLTNLSDRTTRQFSSLPQTVDGINVALTGPMAAGDRFTIAPTRNGARDFAVATTDATRIATAAPVAASIASTNTGSARVASLAVIPASPLPSGLRTPVNVRFDVSGPTTTYDLVDPATNTVLSANNAYSDGATISANGWNLTLSGTPSNGDVVAVGPNTNGTGDNRNALLLANVQQTMVTSSGSAQETYNGLVGVIGNKANEASSLSTAQDNLLTQAQDSRDAVSGVNLDEEAVNLQKYQQAYQAASKSIATAQVMFQTVLALFS